MENGEGRSGKPKKGRRWEKDDGGMSSNVGNAENVKEREVPWWSG